MNPNCKIYYKVKSRELNKSVMLSGTNNFLTIKSTLGGYSLQETHEISMVQFEFIDDSFRIYPFLFNHSSRLKGINLFLIILFPTFYLIFGRATHLHQTH